MSDPATLCERFLLAAIQGNLQPAMLTPEASALLLSIVRELERERRAAEFWNEALADVAALDTL